MINQSILNECILCKIGMRCWDCDVNREYLRTKGKKLIEREFNLEVESDVI